MAVERDHVNADGIVQRRTNKTWNFQRFSPPFCRDAKATLLLHSRKPPCQAIHRSLEAFRDHDGYEFDRHAS